jgi:preprotein translocase subunit SecA
MKLEEEERTELAVHAHARHNFTDYDSYLTEQRKVGNRGSSLRSEARERVHKQVKSIVNSWRPDKIDTVATRLSNRYPQRATALAVEIRKRFQQNRKGQTCEAKDGRACNKILSRWS